MVDTSDEWIVTRTGIRERRIAAPDETVATMSFHAASHALEMAGVAKEDIGLIVVATTTSSHAFPSSACQVQQMLGIQDCAAFDIAAACAGFTYALSVADQYVKNGAVKHALVIGSDVLSRTLDPEDRGTIILFGDGAGAVVLGASEEPGIISTHLHADGRYGNLLALPNKDRQNPDQPAYVTMAGQGSQTLGMLAELAAQFPIVEQTFSDASAALGYDLWQLVQHGPAEELNKTWQTQPALLAASVAIFRVWQQQGGNMPLMMAGHSLGEYSALVCAGVLDFAAAIRLVELRGKLMQEAVPEGTGAMYAIIGLDNDAIAKACEESAQGQVVSPVNFNSPGQVVIAGNKEAVERAGAACKAAGAKRALPLPVSVPSHCALMKPAADKLAVALQDITFNAPLVPVVNNVDVRAETAPEAIRSALVRQLYSPVRWTESVEFMAAEGVTLLLEVGPGKVLTGLTKRIVDTLTAAAVNDTASLSAALEQ
ncbi:hypothetical protein HA402_012345 [Bradysia odoriphaga]|nr:hypothetical protein HA402_012345 [Bradysia odoriphaga]